MDSIYCKWVRARLALLVGDTEGLAGTGGDLPDQDREQIAAHLLLCESCEAHHRQLKRAMAVLEIAAAAPQVKPSAPSVWPEIESRIQRRRQRPESRLTRLLTAILPRRIQETGKLASYRYQSMRGEAPFHLAWIGDSFREAVRYPAQLGSLASGRGRLVMKSRYQLAINLSLAGVLGVLFALGWGAMHQVPTADQVAEIPLVDNAPAAPPEEHADVVIKVNPVTTANASNAPSLTREASTATMEQSFTDSAPRHKTELTTISAATAVPTSSPRPDPRPEGSKSAPVDARGSKAAY